MGRPVAPLNLTRQPLARPSNPTTGPHIAAGRFRFSRSLEGARTLRIKTFCIALLTTTPAVADLHIDTLTTPSGFGLSQNGVPIPLEPYDAAYGATLAPGPFTLTLNGDVLERVAVMFGYGFFSAILTSTLKRFLSVSPRSTRGGQTGR